jgi:protein TonB
MEVLMRNAIAAFLLVVTSICAPPLAAAQEIARETSPMLIREFKPDYTKEARDAKIEGVVEMNAVVLEDGTVGDVTITKSLDQKYGLDDEAIKALKKWRFKPGTKDGKPVAVTVSVEMSFTLRR